MQEVFLVYQDVQYEGREVLYIVTTESAAKLAVKFLEENKKDRPTDVKFTYEPREVIA